jgi:hypothetical protein
MKKNVVLGTLGIVLAFVLVFFGCASFGGGPGTLSGSITVTDIPAEYNGKTIAGGYQGKNAEGKKWTVSGKDATDSKAAAAIVDGQVTMGAYTTGPVDTAGFTADLLLDIHDPSHPNRSYNTIGGILFEGVQFQNGSAQLKWDDGIKTGAVTITGIPDSYNGGKVEVFPANANLFVGETLKMSTGGLSSMLAGIPTPSGTEINVIGDIADGKLELPLWVAVSDGKLISLVSTYKPCTEDAVKDVVLIITVGSTQTSEISSRAVTETFFFQSVTFTNGNATISFSEGKKQ